MSSEGPNGKPQLLNTVRVPTERLKTIVSQHKKTSTDERFRKFMDTLRTVYSQYYSCLAEFHPGTDRALMAHRIMNKSIEQSPATESTCQRGCAACCYLEVEVTQDEAELLTQLVQGGVEIDRAQLAKQATRERADEAWKKLLDESNRCVFLGPDRSCRIYDFRPLSCRKHLVSSPAVECSNENGKIEPILLPLAELALSAALSQPGNKHQSLSKAISDLLGDAATQTQPRPEAESDLPTELPIDL